MTDDASLWGKIKRAIISLYLWGKIKRAIISLYTVYHICPYRWENKCPSPTDVAWILLLEYRGIYFNENAF